MSRIAKMGVSVPTGVDVQLKDNLITVKGTGGELKLTPNPLVKITSDNGKLSFVPVDESREANAMSGTMRQMVNNMVVGVSKGFEKKLTLVGVGFRAQAQGNKLNLAIGFSHPVNFEMPAGISVATPSPTEIIIKGADRQSVGQVAAKVREVRPPEPYKGKGIRYADERVVIKETKKK
ncbi:50S ribosomal protein L6 [Ottowia sp. GY511]|uniref:Large ribosomal subunit protein uL6 n=1 Tax=Ottowia flava TaxID=2675430 RepID=A0ABW4KRI8_9BURK|nr:50S ribosomal protein L6 [Ottowia sp. GY511]TXK30925.1 50S ribosomal protein L6 [Ottowia sp. GY511]